MNERLAHALKWSDEKKYEPYCAVQAKHRSKLAYDKVKAKLDSDPQFKLLTWMRGRISSALKLKSRKVAKTQELLGCTPRKLKKWLESQFTEGMTWENYGKWHVDHIKPCSKFNLLDPDEQRKCFHFSNLQPLWAIDNWRKSDKWVEEAESKIPL